MDVTEIIIGLIIAIPIMIAMIPLFGLILLLEIIKDPVNGCNICICTMEYLSYHTGISYELINVLLFVILGPLTTILFGTSTILALRNKRKPAIIIGTIAAVIAVVVLTCGLSFECMSIEVSLDSID